MFVYVEDPQQCNATWTAREPTNRYKNINFFQKGNVKLLLTTPLTWAGSFKHTKRRLIHLLLPITPVLVYIAFFARMRSFGVSCQGTRSASFKV